jgi:hypothetical protein
VLESVEKARQVPGLFAVSALPKFVVNRLPTKLHVLVIN